LCSRPDRHQFLGAAPAARADKSTPGDFVGVTAMSFHVAFIAHTF
jgi:hypothetical protein